MPAVPTPRRLSRAVREFLATEAAGGVVLLVGAVVALLWANSPWDGAYEQLWHTELRLDLGRWSIAEDLRHWVNDAAMALFFFVVGLEIKRELVVGELRQPRQAALPVIAALGGMVVPALLYLAVAGGSDGANGWGIPMATDIAFAIGVVSLLGSRVSSSLKLFLLTLAIADDIGAILVIAVVYSDGVDPGALGIAGLLVLTVVGLRLAGVRAIAVYVVVGAGVWLATYESGVHATIAGVVLGLLTPAVPARPEELAREWERELADEPTTEQRLAVVQAANAGISVADRLTHALHPISSFVIVPLFALANAGVRIEGDALDGPGAAAVAGGVAVGLVVGKLVGVFGATALAVHFRVATLPEGATWGGVAGVAAVAGIGFTVSLFVAGLAFDDPGLESAAKLGVLAASAIAALLGSILLRRQPPVSSS